MLPYKLAKQLQLPTDPNERSLELTELHCTFNNDYYRIAVGHTNWQLSSSDEMSNSTHSATKHWLHELHPDSQASHMSEIVTLDTPINEAEGHPPASEDETPTVPLPVCPVAPELLNKQSTEDDITRASASTIKRSSSPLTDINLRQHTTDSVRRQTTAGLSISDVLHLANDIALAATCAQNLRKKRRFTTTIPQLVDSVSKEIDTLNDKGKNYVPFTRTELDHPVALARESISCHKIEQIYDWLEHKNPVRSTHDTSCIFNFLEARPHSTPPVHDPTLDNCLIMFARTALDLLQKDSKHKKHALSAVKALLEERQMLTTFEFALNAPLEKLILNDKELLSYERSKRLPKSQKPKVVTTSLKETVPPLSLNTRRIIDNNLLPAVQSELKSEDFPLDQIRESFRAPNALFLICQKIMQYNPRWDTPTFSVTLHQLEQALSMSELECTTMEKLHLRYTCNNVLTILRSSQSKT